MEGLDCYDWPFRSSKGKSEVGGLGGSSGDRQSRLKVVHKLRPRLGRTYKS